MDFLKGILKWIIIAVILVILVVLIMNLVNKSDTSTKKPTNEYEPGIDIVDSNQDNIEDENRESYSEDLIVDSPDTASDGSMQVLLGFMIMTAGVTYIYRRQKIKGNS